MLLLLTDATERYILAEAPEAPEKEKDQNQEEAERQSEIETEEEEEAKKKKKKKIRREEAKSFGWKNFSNSHPRPY